MSVEDGRVKTYWTETSFDGSRMTRGAEFCDAVREEDRDQEFRTFKEGWMGFKMNIEPGHNTESNSALAQVFQFDDSECAPLLATSCPCTLTACRSFVCVHEVWNRGRSQWKHCAVHCALTTATALCA